ncbi:extracellular calcium-sensing receptor-like [Ascaphus truei]|uniref:extracellular calcium-sensing receptor-like n=1 Tax=Ascaphus truei TaxID=8439 RepID=UPI003F59B70D
MKFAASLTSWVLLLIRGHRLFSLALVLLFCSAAGGDVSLSSNCKLVAKFRERYTYYSSGDIMLAGLLQFGDGEKDNVPTFEDEPMNSYRHSYYPRLYRHYLGFLFAINEINQRKDLLPNITLGYVVYDSENNEREALQKTILLLSGGGDMIPNYVCHRRGVLAAYIGDLNSATTYTMSLITKLYHYPQISYGSMDSSFNDRLQFPNLYRTVPNEHYQQQAIVQLLQHFGWTWVGILTSDDDSSQRGSQELKDLIISSGICVEFLQIYNAELDHLKQESVQTVGMSSAKVVIIYSSNNIFDDFIYEYSRQRQQNKIWIVAATVTYLNNFALDAFLFMLNGTLSLSVRNGDISGLKDFLHSANMYKYPGDPAIKELWMNYFGCLPYIPGSKGIFILRPCTENKTLQSLPPFIYDVHNFRYTYSIYTAVYMLAHALHDMFQHRLSLPLNRFKDNSKLDIQPWKLNSNLKHVHFTPSSGEEIVFTKDGDVPGLYDIINWITTSDPTVTGIKVGSFNSSAPVGQQLTITDNDIQWNPNVTLVRREAKVTFSEERRYSAC